MLRNNTRYASPRTRTRAGLYFALLRGDPPLQNNTQSVAGAAVKA